MELLDELERRRRAAGRPGAARRAGPRAASWTAGGELAGDELSCPDVERLELLDELERRRRAELRDVERLELRHDPGRPAWSCSTS